MPSRQPRRPSIGFTSSSERTDAGQLLAAVSEVARARPARSPAPSSARGRNSCSGGSSSRMVTGSPPSPRKIPRSRPAASAAARRAPPAARRILRHDHLPHRGWRSPSKNMCSVRQRPIPSAPKSTGPVGVRGRVRVGAHPSWRSRSAQPEHAVEMLVQRRRSRAACPGRHDAAGAVERDPVPLAQTRPPTLSVRPPRSISSAVAPADARPSHSPGHQRRVAGLPAPGGEDALAATMPGNPRPGPRPHQDHRLALAAALGGRVGVEDDLARGGPRRGRHAGGQRRRARRSGRWSGAGAGRGRWAAIRATASSSLISPRPPCRRRSGARPRRCAGRGGTAACRACPSRS